MNTKSAKIVARNIQDTMDEQGLSRKDLVEKSGLPYPTLAPILSASRDCRFSTLITIATALGCSPNKLAAGLFDSDKVPSGTDKASLLYYLGLVSNGTETECLLFNKKLNELHQLTLGSPLLCGMPADKFTSNILDAIDQCSKKINEKIQPESVCIFASVQQFHREAQRHKIQKLNNSVFYSITLESDAAVNYHALVGNQNGICISINSGDMITYSTDKGKTIHQAHGAGFPISDVAGSFWLACHAMKHAIRSYQGLDEETEIANKILALFKNDIGLISEITTSMPEKTYAKVAVIIEPYLWQKGRMRDLVKLSANLIMEDINLIDKISHKKLPIFLAGEFADIYAEHFTTKRLKPTKKQQIKIVKDYVIKQFSLITHVTQ